MRITEKLKSRTLRRVLAYIFLPLLFSITGYVLFYIALSSYLKPMADSMHIIVRDNEDENSANEIHSIFKDTENVLGQETVDESLIEMPTFGTHYASLEISSVSLSADLYFGDSSAILKKGLGQYIGSSIPGYGKPLLIGGHNNGEFNKLQYVNNGDIVTIKTNYGVYQYRISDKEIASSTSTSAYDLTQKKEQLILYTCYPFDTLGLTSQRFFVYADKVSGPVIISGSQGQGGQTP